MVENLANSGQLVPPPQKKPSNLRLPPKSETMDANSAHEDSLHSQELHYQCDSVSCPQARFCQPAYDALRKEERFQIYFDISVEELERTAGEGCSVCGVFYEGFQRHVEKFDVEGILKLRGEEGEGGVEEREVFLRVPLGSNYRFSFDVGEEKKGEMRPSIGPLEFFKPQVSEWPDSCRVFESARYVAPSTSSDHTFENIHHWVDTCRREHPMCPGLKLKPNELPSLLVDVGPHSDGADCKLRETRGKKGHYLTLSHCWGKTKMFRTTIATLEARKLAINLEELSQTFRDAVLITRQLGFRYLWIDSLCIIQDDPKDWEAESAKMCSIYELSFLMISAAHGSDGDAGCFVEMAEDQQSYEIPGISGGDKSGISIRRLKGHRDFDGEGMYDHALFKRAWTFQERLLAPRIIHFTKNECVWECSSAMWCECGSMSVVRPNIKLSTAVALLESKEVTAQRLGTEWHWLVENYCSTDITRESDKLPALSGLAQAFSRANVLGEYIAGLWANDLPDGLLWMAGEDAMRPEQYRAPSWSWASLVSGGITYPSYKDEGWEERRNFRSIIKESSVRILEAKCDLPVGGTDVTGAVAGGHIVLLGLLVEVTLEILDDDERVVLAGGDIEFSVSREGMTEYVRLDDPFGDELLETQTVHCLLVGRSWTDELCVLVLRREDNDDVYKRVGHSICNWQLGDGGGFEKEFFEDSQPCVIRII